MNIYYVIMYIGMTASILPVLSGIFYFQRLSPAFKILLVYLSCSMLSNLVALFFASNGQNNYIVFHFYTLIETLLLLWIFSRWQSAPLMRRLLLSGAFLFGILWVISKITLENFQEMDFFTSSVGHMILAFASVYTIIHLAHETKEKLLWESIFWVSIAVLFYTGGTIFIYSISRQVIHEVWFIQNIVVTIYYLVISWSFRIEAIRR